MRLKHLQIKAEPLTRDSFAPYGDVLAPTPGRIDNNTLLDGGHARMSDPVPGARRDDFDVLDYWGDIATISRDTMRLGYLRTKKRALAFSWFERHLKGTQSFMPLGGADSIICVGKASDPAIGTLPDLNTVKAFRMDGRAGINLHPGTWHWTPFPVGDAADFIILVREAVVDDDLHFIDLEARMNTRIEIVL